MGDHEVRAMGDGGGVRTPPAAKEVGRAAFANGSSTPIAGTPGSARQNGFVGEVSLSGGNVASVVGGLQMEIGETRSRARAMRFDGANRAGEVGAPWVEERSPASRMALTSTPDLPLEAQPNGFFGEVTLSGGNVASVEGGREMKTSVTLPRLEALRLEDVGRAKMIGTLCGERAPCIGHATLTETPDVPVAERQNGADAEVFPLGGNVASDGGHREMKTSETPSGLDVGRFEDASRAGMEVRCRAERSGIGHGAWIGALGVPVRARGGGAVAKVSPSGCDGASDGGETRPEIVHTPRARVRSRTADATTGMDEARCRAELLAMVTPGVTAVERRIDVSTVIDRFGSKLRVVSALVVTKEDGARLGIVLAPPSRIADRIALPARVVRANDATSGPTMLSVAPVAMIEQAFAHPADL